MKVGAWFAIFRMWSVDRRFEKGDARRFLWLPSFFLLLFIAVNGAAQTRPCSDVTVRDATGETVLKYWGTPVFDYKNGYLCVSITSQNQDMIQLNGINTDDIRVVYISSKNGLTFSSNSKRSRIRSKIKSDHFKPGSPLALIVDTRVFSNETYYRIKVKLSGEVPEQSHTILNE